MTCIVGCVDKRGKVWLAGDASNNGTNTIEVVTDPKVRRSGGVLLGASGEWFMLDLIRRLDCPSLPTEEWVRYGLSSDLRRLRRELGFEGKADDDSELLVGARGALWWADSDLSIIRQGKYAATGSGSEFAMGVLCDRDQRLGKLACVRALVAASRHCPSVRGPFEVVSL
jgi:hypothetical protein